jgi:xanthine dehydrogenase/oxidase
MAAGAEFTLAGAGTGERTVAARDFFLGYRKVDMQPHEVLVKVRRKQNYKRTEAWDRKHMRHGTRRRA